MRLLRLAVVLALLLSSTKARSQSAPATGPSAGFRRQLPPEPLERPPPPARDGDEFARRAWEVAVGGGPASALCRGGDTDNACQALGVGTRAEVTAWWRPTPLVALGVELSGASFRARQRWLADDIASASATTTFAGVVARGFFLDRGFLEPFVEAGFGRGSISHAYDTTAGRVLLAAVAPSTRVGAGLDFWLLPSIRLGPAVSYHWTFAGSLDACGDGPCRSIAVADVGAATSYLSFDVTATIALGREM